MPGLITHYICGEASARELPAKRRAVIQTHRQLYNIGTQGPDIFFYYYPGLLKKRLRDLGSKMHNAGFRNFMDALLSNVPDMEKRQLEAFTAYLAGYLSHYCLDYITHPFIYYHSGFRKSGNVKELKYSVYHRRFETAIDVLMLKLLSGEKPSDKKLWQMISVKKKDALAIMDFISGAIGSAYNVPVSGKEVFRAFVYMSGTTMFLQSAKGRRKKFIELAENMTIREKVLSSLIHLQEIGDGLDYLNLKKQTWLAPWDEKKEDNSSFTDLFSQATLKSTELINTLFDYTEGKTSKDEALSIFGNYSFASGVDSDTPVEFKFSRVIFEN